MKEIMSNANDCLQLAVLLQKKLGNKLKIVGSAHQEIISGSYRILPYEAYATFNEYKKDELTFAFKFCEDGFLRVQIGNGIYKSSIGHKLAALSDFYEVISELYGNPTVYYTTKDDDEEILAMQWSFCDIEETITAFKTNTMFDDAEVDELIIFGDSTKDNEPNPFKLTSQTKAFLAESIGLPFELINLVDENIEDFIFYKTRTKRTGSSKSYTPKSISINEKLKQLGLINPSNK